MRHHLFTHPRFRVLGIPIGHQRADWHALLDPGNLRRAAGAGLAGASVAAGSYVGWTMIRMAASVRRSVQSVARTVEVGADQLSSKMPAGKGESPSKANAAH